jgi:hypothetical protein
MREGIGPHLYLYGHGSHALAAFLHPRRAVAARNPQSTAFPAGAWIIDATVEALGEEARRIRHLDGDHLPVLEGKQAVVEIAGRDRDVVAETERVVLIDPGIVARLGAVLADALKSRSGVLIE